MQMMMNDTRNSNGKAIARSQPRSRHNRRLTTSATDNVRQEIETQNTLSSLRSNFSSSTLDTDSGFVVTSYHKAPAKKSNTMTTTISSTRHTVPHQP